MVEFALVSLVLGLLVLRTVIWSRRALNWWNSWGALGLAAIGGWLWNTELHGHANRPLVLAYAVVSVAYAGFVVQGMRSRDVPR